MHFDPLQIPESELSEEQSWDDRRLAQQPVQQSRPLARNYDLSHRDIMKIYQNWEKGVKITNQSLLPSAPEGPKYPPPPNSQAASDSRTFNFVKLKKQVPEIPKPHTPKLPASKRNSASKIQSPPKTTQPQPKSTPPKQQSRPVTNKFKSKLASQQNLKQASPQAKAVSSKQLKQKRLKQQQPKQIRPLKNSRIMARKQLLQQVDQCLIQISEEQLQLQLQIKDIHRHSKALIEKITVGRGIKFTPPTLTQEKDKAKLQAELALLNDRLQRQLSTVDDTLTKISGLKIQTLLYDPQGQMKQVQQFQVQNDPSEDDRPISEISYFKSKISSGKQNKLQNRTSYYMQHRREKDQPPSPAKLQKFKGEVIPEQSEEELEEDPSTREVKQQIKVNQELKNLLFS